MFFFYILKTRTISSVTGKKKIFFNVPVKGMIEYKNNNNKAMLGIGRSHMLLTLLINVCDDS